VDAFGLELSVRLRDRVSGELGTVDDTLAGVER
jgi:hypothetical protein